MCLRETEKEKNIYREGDTTLNERDGAELLLWACVRVVTSMPCIARANSTERKEEHEMFYLHTQHELIDVTHVSRTPTMLGAI